MVKLNDNFQKLPANYLFATISEKVKAFSSEHPEKSLVRLGIGDVTRPLVPAVVSAMAEAVQEMGNSESFRGYGPDQGYDFLLEAILEQDYRSRGVSLEKDEIFISDGCKSDCGNIGELFSRENRVAVCDPVYPVYVDSNVLAGRAGSYNENSGLWSDLLYLPCRREHQFIPQIPKGRIDCDLIYLCFPNNPSGSAISYKELENWVNYASEIGAVIIYDGAYEAFISEDLPHSIFEIPGAKECAIELRSFSKTAGFTGVRCGYAVIPKELRREGVALRDMWARRQSTKFNGVSYITQRGAAAVYSPEGQEQVRKVISGYMDNAAYLRKELLDLGYEVYGGVNAPYLWLKTKDELSSWEFFDLLLQEVGLVGTPGAGFGPSGEGYFRLTAFGSTHDSEEAIRRLQTLGL